MSIPNPKTDFAFAIDKLVTLKDGDGTVFAIVRQSFNHDKEPEYTIASTVYANIERTFVYLRFHTRCPKTVKYIEKINAFLQKHFNKQEGIPEDQLSIAPAGSTVPPAPLETIEGIYRRHIGEIN